MLSTSRSIFPLVHAVRFPRFFEKCAENQFTFFIGGSICSARKPTDIRRQGLVYVRGASGDVWMFRGSEHVGSVALRGVSFRVVNSLSENVRYLTPRGSAGFAPHWDEIDAFLLQLEGKKYWKVYAPDSLDNELPREPSGESAPLLTVKKQYTSALQGTSLMMT